MSDNEKTPVGNVPENSVSGSPEPFSGSEDVDRILSDILGADGSYKDDYNSMYTRYNGVPASPAPVMRRHPVEEPAVKPVPAAGDRVREPLPTAPERREVPQNSPSRDGELSYRERYAQMYGTPAPRRRVNDDYPQYNNRYPEDSRRRTDINRLPDDVNRIFEYAQREAQSPAFSTAGVKYPTLRDNRSGERVIYDADWEERAQREAANELQRRMRNPDYDYPQRGRGYDSDFVAGGVPLSRAGVQNQYSPGPSLIDPLTQDDNLYINQKYAPRQQKKNSARVDGADINEADAKKPFFSQGFPVSQANNKGTVNGETAAYSYGEDDAVLNSFSADYSTQLKRDEMWKQPVEKDDKRRKKGFFKQKEPSRNTPANTGTQNTDVPTGANIAAEKTAAKVSEPVKAAIPPVKPVLQGKGVLFSVDDSADYIHSDVAPGFAPVSQEAGSEIKTPAEFKRPVEIQKPAEIRTPAEIRNSAESEKKAADAEKVPADEGIFFGEEDFDNIVPEDGSGIDAPAQSGTKLFDMGVFDPENQGTGFVVPESLEPPVKRGERFKRFIHNNFPNKEDSKLNILRKLVMDVSFVALICSIVYLGVYYINYRVRISNEQELGEIIREYDDGYSKDELTELWNDIHAQYPDVVFPEGMNIRFARLYAVNQDVAGWLNVPGKNIDTVILQTDDNSHYLYKDFYGNSSRYGNPFLDYRNVIAPKSLSKSTIIYGHNTHDNLEFASLLDYMKIEGYKNSPVIQFDTLYDTTYWKVFAVMLTNAEPSGDNGYVFDYLIPSYGSDAEFMNVVAGIRERSMINTGIDVAAGDNMLLLYTCYNNIFREGRLVVAARQVREGESTDVDTSTASFNYNARYPQAYYTAKKLNNPYSSADDRAVYTQAPVTQAQTQATQAQTSPAEESSTAREKTTGGETLTGQQEITTALQTVRSEIPG